MDIILVKMEKDSEDFCRRLIELAMEYGYTTCRETYKTNNISVGDLVIIPSKRQVLVSDKEVFFTSKEFDILELLVANRGQVFSRGKSMIECGERVTLQMIVISQPILTKSVKKLSRISPDRFTFRRYGV